MQAAPPFLPHPPPHLHPPPSWSSSSSSSSSLSPLRHSSYHQEKGAGQKAARRRAPTPSKISSIGEPKRILVSSSLPCDSVGAEILGLSTPLFSQPSLPSLTSLSQQPPSPRTKAITSTLTRVAAAHQSHSSLPTRPAVCFLLHCYHSGVSLCPPLVLAISPYSICHTSASDLQPFL